MRWESSRIILPIHRERINQHRKELLKREKLILDEQQVTEFAQIIAE
ncbi:YolD-like family protein [Bacillus solimangrovi]|nr:YolD-like family protein [Bacillus solimangrovi]